MLVSTLILGVVAVVLAAARGGSPAALLNIRFEALWALWLGLAIQVGANLWSPAWLTGEVALAVLLGSNAIVVYFVMRNRRLPGLPLVAAGFALNLVVIAANGAMTVSPTAADIAGVAPERIEAIGIEWETLDSGTVLPWIADVIPLPWTGSVISVGDIMIAIGVAVLVYRGSYPVNEGIAERTRT